MNCEICNTKLNMYNPGPRCLRHTEGEIIEEVLPKFLCAVSPNAEWELTVDEGTLQLKPGTSGYNETVYSRYAVGQVQEDGTVRYFEEEEI